MPIYNTITIFSIVVCRYVHRYTFICEIYLLRIITEQMQFLYLHNMYVFFCVFILKEIVCVKLALSDVGTLWQLALA
jgi:hypothetical protein